MPNAGIDTNQTYFNKLIKSGDYSICKNSSEGTDLERRTYLINAMSEKSNWDELLTGTINGHIINETRTEHVFAMGSPDIELWKNSWNTTYLEDTLYTRYADNLGSNPIYDGWYIGNTANPSSQYINLSGKVGVNNTLYFPHALNGSGNSSYWIASPSASGKSRILGILRS